MIDSDRFEGHKLFSTVCFNHVWDLLEMSSLTAEQTETMIDAAHASRYHWRMRDDGTPRNIAVSSWQLSRVYAAAGRADEALRYGQQSLEACIEHDLAPFYRGYAYEALARASILVPDRDAARRYAADARQALAAVEDAEERSMLGKDVSEIEANERLG